MFRRKEHSAGNGDGHMLNEQEKLIRDERLEELTDAALSANKMDLENADENLKRFKEKYPDLEVFETMTLINEGLQPVLYRAKDLLKTLPQFPLYDTAKTDQKVVYTYEEEVPFTIFNEGNGIWRVEGERISRLFHNTDFKNEDSVVKFSRTLSRMKLDEALREKGCRNGDQVFIEDYSFDFMDEEDED